MGEIKIDIKGFMGKRNLKINLQESDPFIIVSENGSGKTTLLTIIAHLFLGSLGEEYKNYVAGKFDSISAEALINGKIKKAEIHDLDLFNKVVSSIAKRPPRYFYNFVKRFMESNNPKLESINYEIINQIEFLPMSLSKKAFEDYLKSGNISREILFDYYDYLMNKNSDRIVVIDEENEFTLQYEISNFLTDEKIETIFLPVSRQLELKNRKFSDNTIYSQINIKSVLDQTINEIRVKSSEANSKIFKNVFSYLSTDSTSETTLNNDDAIRILNERMASLITLKTSDNLKNIILSSKSQSGMIKKMLLEINKQLEKDVYPLEKKLNDFINACNHFFENKKFVYDSNKIQLDLKINESEQLIQPTELSSGELHIVTIFAKIFLLTSEGTRLIIIIDEPELSLSIEWQKKFVQTVLESNKIFSLILSTHSPFIVGTENENGEFQYQKNLFTMTDLVNLND